MVEAVPEIRGRVLLLDPDAARAARRCGQLAASGWQAQASSDLVEALSALRAVPADLVLLHVSADEAQALDLPRVLRLASQVPHLPVVVAAPRPAEHVCCRFLDSGADEIVHDAISPAELAARLRALLRVKRLQDELQTSRAALTAALTRERALLTQSRRDNARLQTLAATDPLTHLQNARHFDAVLDGEFRIARRYDRRLSAMALDLDHFKVVNDTYGHPSGDYVLKEFAVILKRSVRDSDVVARTGGEEFSLVLPQAGRAQCRRLAQRIRRAVRERVFTAYGRDIRLTVSLGCASFPEDSEVTEAHMLVHFADQALLRAKQLGRDRILAFHELDRPARFRLRQQLLAPATAPQLVEDLRR